MILDKITVPWTCDSQEKFFDGVFRGFKYFMLYALPIIFIALGFYYEMFDTFRSAFSFMMIGMIIIGMPWAFQLAFWFSENEFPFKCRCENKK